jgi:hypothetical protein
MTNDPMTNDPNDPHVLRISHHCAFVGTSTTTIPGLSPIGAALTSPRGHLCPIVALGADVNVAAAELKLTPEKWKAIDSIAG